MAASSLGEPRYWPGQAPISADGTEGIGWEDRRLGDELDRVTDSLLGLGGRLEVGVAMDKVRVDTGGVQRPLTAAN